MKYGLIDFQKDAVTELLKKIQENVYMSMVI